jgi:hypothetical protein
MSSAKNIRQRFINQTKRNMELTHEKRLKHFQLALSMVGVSANLMTCELIHTIAAKVDEKGESFSLGDATALAEGIQTKYQGQMGPAPGTTRGNGMPFPPGQIPDHIQKLMDEGKIVMGANKENPVPMRHDDNIKDILPEGPPPTDDGTRPQPPQS